LLSAFLPCCFSCLPFFPSFFLSPFFVCVFLWSVNGAMSAFGCCFSLYKLCEDWYCFEQVVWWLSYLYVFRKYLIQLSVQTAIISKVHIVVSTLHICQVIFVEQFRNFVTLCILLIFCAINLLKKSYFCKNCPNNTHYIMILKSFYKLLLRYI